MAAKLPHEPTRAPADEKDPGAEGPRLPADAVIWAHRLLLNREPTASEIENHRIHENAAALRQALAPRRFDVPLWLLAPPSNPAVPWRFEPPRLAKPTSQLCTASQFDEPEYSRIVEAFGERPRTHRKQWEFCWIVSVMREADLLRPGTRMVGFGVGREPLPSMLAANGVSVTATDAPTETVAADGWANTGQHSVSLMQLHRPRLLDEATFKERVTFRTVDMNMIPDDLTGFDACWSACAFEHLGGIEPGLQFVMNSMKTLRPGGIAIHTTEFNIGSNDATLESRGLSLYRRRDVEALLLRLIESGHDVWPLNLHPGFSPIDAHVDAPPYSHPHLKIEAAGHLTTSIGIVVRKAAHDLVEPGAPVPTKA